MLILGIVEDYIRLCLPSLYSTLLFLIISIITAPRRSFRSLGSGAGNDLETQVCVRLCPHAALHSHYTHESSPHILVPAAGSETLLLTSTNHMNQPGVCQLVFRKKSLSISPTLIITELYVSCAQSGIWYQISYSTCIPKHATAKPISFFKILAQLGMPKLMRLLLALWIFIWENNEFILQKNCPYFNAAPPPGSYQ